MVRIHSREDFLGTGFLVHRTNDASFVMTCRHVIDEFLKIPSALRIFFPNGKTFEEVSIVNEDESVDLALLRYLDINTSGSPTALQLSPPGAPYVGPVELVAYFTPSDAVTTRPGIATGLIVGEPETPRLKPALTCLCNFSNEVDEFGTSGGPLMAKEIVIGVHTAGAAGIKYSIMANAIYETLRKWSNTTKEGTEISDMLTKIAAETATASPSAPIATPASSKQ